MSTQTATQSAYALPRTRHDILYLLTIGIAITLPIHAIPPFGGVTLSLGDVLSTLFVLIALPVMLANLYRPVMLALTLWLLILCAATLLASLSGKLDFGLFFVQLTKNVISVAYFLIFYTIFRKRPELIDVFVNTTIYVMTIFAIVACANVFVLGNEARAVWPFRNPNAFAAYLLFTLACALPLTLQSGVTVKSLAILGTLALGLLATGSRGGMLSIVMGIVSWTLISFMTGASSPQRLKTVFAALMALGVLVGGYGVVMTLASEGAGQLWQRSFTVYLNDPRDEVRFLLWDKAIRSFEDSPIYGVGLGQYGFEGATSDPNGVLETHNTYLSYLAETGLFGLGSGLILLILLYTRLSVQKSSLPLRDAMLIYIPAMGTQAFFNNVDNFRIVWIGLAIAVCIANMAQQRDQRTPSSAALVAAQRNKAL